MITFRSFIQRKSRPVVSVLGSLLRFRNVVLPLLFGAILVFTHAQQVHAGPKDGNVVAGDANIVQLNPKLLEIIQASDKVIIDWRSFSIDWDELVRFLQPDSDSIALNRVNGDTPSYILGQLTADGRVMLINPNGVLFGDSAVVDIGSLVATTIDIRNEDFMAGDYNFDVDRASGGTVVNRGRITAAEGGIVALVAPGVENSGVIVARLGRVALASGNSFALDFYGDRLIQIGVDDSVAERLLAPDGTELKALVDNSGEIYADGGTVMLMAASVAKDVVDYAINMEGIIEARTATERNGEIVLEGAGEGIVRVTGTLDASGRESGDTGGEVKILGSKVGLVGQAEVDVSGDAGGGEVLIGGNFQGRGPERNADFTTIGSEVAIQADALTTGDGGRVIVWSDRVTRFYGNISARGGRDSGDGGFAEISGKQHLQFAPNSIDLSAPKGLIGELLLDPLDIFISDGNGSDDSVFSGDNVINFNDDSTATYNITPAAFEAIDADITLQALRDITVNSPIDRDGSGDSTLTLQAGNNLIINANITGSMGAHSFIFEADSPRSSNNDGIGKLEIASGVTITSNNGDITLIGARFEIDTSSMTSIDAGTGDIYVAPSQASLMTISTTADLSLAEIGRFTTSGTIYIGTATTGPSGSGGPGISISVIGITVSEALTISGSASLVLDSGGTTTLSADISTNGNITFEDAVTLAANVTVDSDANDDGAGGDITFTSTVDSTIVPGQGYRTLTLDAADGSVALQGVVGNTSALRNLANLAVTGGSITLSADVSTDDGDITFSGPVTLAANVTVDSDALGGTTGGNIKFESTVDGDYALTLDAGGGTVELQGAVGAATKLVSLAVTGGTIKLSADISTDNGAITFTGAVELVGDVTVDSDSAGGAITFTSTVISAAGGNRTLTVNAGSGAVEFRGAVGVTDPTDPTTKLASLTVDGGQIDLDTVATTGAIEIESGTGINEGINLNGASYQSDDGDITFRGPVDLHADVTVDSDADEDATDGEIKFTSTVDGAHALTLDADRGVLGASGPPRVGGKVTLLGAVGGTSATSKLASLTVKAIEVSLKSVSTTGLITINSNNINLDGNYLSDNANITIDVFEIGIALLTLDGAVRLDSDAAAGEINISAWVTGGHMLTLDAGGIVNVAGEIGGDSGGLTKLASLTVVGGQIELYNVATTGPIAIEGTDIDLNGASYESDNGAITFSGPVGLVGDVTVATAGNITFTSTVTSQTMPGVPNRELTVNAGSGTVAFQGVVGGTDATTELSELAVTGGKIELSANVSTDNGAITFTGAVELLGDVTVDSDSAGGDIKFTSTVDSASGGNRTLTVDAGSGEVAFEGAVGATTALASLTVDGGEIDLDTVATTGAIDIEGTDINLNGASYKSENGVVKFTGPVDLHADVTVESDVDGSSAAGGNITFTSTVDSTTISGVRNRTLTVNAGSGEVAFEGAVGATTKLSELAVTGGEIKLSANVSTDNGAITFTGAVELLGDVTVDSDSAGGAITFTSTVVSAAGGNRTLTVDAGSGAVAFQGAVGGTTATTALSGLAVTGGEITLSADVSIDGTITFSGPVDLLADVTVTSDADDDGTGDNITFESTVKGAHALTVDAGDGAVAFQGAVGGTTATTALSGLAVTGGEITLSADVSIDGTITFSGPVDLLADVTVTSDADDDGTGDNITFESTVKGAHALTVDAGDGAVAFQGAVGGTTATTALSGLAVTGGEITLSADVSIDGTITFSGPVDLLADVTVTSDADDDGTGDNITFESTVKGAHALTVDAGDGAVAFQGAVGGTTATTALSGLAVTGGEITLSADVSIDGTITFSGPVDLLADVTVTSDADDDGTGDNITFESTVKGAHALTVDAGDGAVAFQGAVGGTTATTALSGLAVTGGEITLSADVSIDGTITFSGPVDLLADVTVTSDADDDGTGDNITFESTVKGAHALTVDAGDGAVAFQGAVGGTTATTALSGLAVTGGEITLSADVSIDGTITFSGPVDLLADVTVTSDADDDGTGDNITFESTVKGAHALTVDAGDGAVAFQGAVGGTTATTALSGLAVTGGEITLSADVSIDGTITFSGPVDLLADVTVTSDADDDGTGDNITFESTVKGAHALTVDAGDGAVAFQGAVGGTTATTALSGLAVTGGEITLSADVSIDGTITFSGPVDLLADVTVTSDADDDGTGDNITFESTVKGAHALTVDAGDGAVAFQGAVGGTTATTALSGLAVTGGEITLSADVSIDGTITFSGPVDLLADVTVTSDADDDGTGDNITFESTVKGAHALTVDAGDGAVAFQGAVGGTTATTALSGLAVTGGEITLSADVSIDGTITFSGPVDLLADVTVTSDADDDGTGDNITFESTVKGAHALTVDAGDGAVAFQGAVGGTTATTALSGLAVTGGEITLSADVSIDGTITFSGPVDLLADVTVTSDADDDGTGDNITFESTVKGAHALTVDAGDGAVAFQGAVGGTTATTALSGLAVTGGEITLSADVSIDGTITFSGPVDLLADVTVTSDADDDGTGDNITFESTVKGAHALTVDAGDGAVAFQGAVGGTTATTALSGLAVTGGEITLSADVSIDGTITFSGPVDLLADVTVTSDADDDGTGDNITFESTVKGAHALTVDAGDGAVAFQGAVGGTTATTALSGLAVTGGEITLSADVSIDGTITFSGPVDLLADVTVTSDADDDGTGDNITFESTVKGAHALTVDAGDGAVAFQGAVGGTTATTALSGLAVTGGEITLSADVSIDGTITFSGPVDLLADVTVTSDADDDGTGDNITFESTVKGAHALTVDAGDGAVAFQGAVGGTTATTALSGLAVTGGEITLSADVSIDGTITFSGPVDLLADVTVTSDADDDGTGDNITFESTVKGAHALTVDAGDGAVAFQGAVGGTTATTALSGLAVTGGEITLSADVSIDGTITFSGPVDLLADVTVTSDADDDGTGDNITFESTVKGAHALTVDAGDGAVAFQGAVGGTSATTKLVSLTVTGGEIDLDTVATIGNIDIEGSMGIALNGVTYASDNGDIILAGAEGVTISGSASLVLRAGGNITVNTSIERIGSADSTLALQAGGNLNINADIIGRNGAHSFIFEADSPGLSSNDGNGTLKIASGVTITSNNGDITLIGAEFEIDTSSSINAGTGDIHVAPSRAVAMTINSDSENLSSAEIGTFTTSGTIYIGTAITGPSSSGGAGSSISATSITVSQNLTISGSASLVLDSSGTTTLSAEVSTDDGNITFEDAVTLSAEVSTENGNITFADAVTLGADVTVDSDADDDGTGGDITFFSMLDGAYNLILNSGTGNIYFRGDVGSADKLSAITVNNAHDVTVETTMWVGSFTQTAGTGTTDFGFNTVYADTSVEVDTMNITGSIVAQEARLTAQEDITAFVEVDALTIEASNAYLFGTIDGVGGRAASDLIVINNRGSGTYTINDSIVLGTGLGTRTYVELSSLPLATITPAAGVFAWLTPMLRASVNDSISGPYIVTDSEASSPLLTPEPGTEDYYEDIPLLLKTHDDEMVEME